MTTSFFTENLKYACATQPSVSHICRQVGINRQQFNRYMGGETRPSPHNLERIASFFQIDAKDFMLTFEQFKSRLHRPRRGGAENSEVFEGFPGDLGALRRHAGYYHNYHSSPSWPGYVICSCSRLSESNGLMHVKYIERIRDADCGIAQFSKCVGLAAFLRNRIFITERSKGRNTTITQTILMPFEDNQRVYLRGVCTGLSWRKENLPYASRMIWRYAGSEPDLREYLSHCGALPINSRRLPQAVRTFLQEPTMGVLTVPTEY